jgi:hypothetical protein
MPKGGRKPFEVANWFLWLVVICLAQISSAHAVYIGLGFWLKQVSPPESRSMKNHHSPIDQFLEDYTMRSCLSKSVCRVLALAIVSVLSISATAQDAAKPAPKPAVLDSASKWDIFLGYSYLDPNGTIPGTQSGAPGSTYGQINWGGIASISRYFNRNLGVQIEGDSHIQSEDVPLGDNNASFNSNDNLAGGSVGLIYRFPMNNLTPFVHALVGGEDVGSPYIPDQWGPVATAGGGLDIETPIFDHHLAIRLFQADYQFIHVDSADINAFRLSTGVVFHLGSIVPPPPVTLVCTATPVSIFPGDPVTVTATAGSLNPKWDTVYSWTGTGVTGSGSTATVATEALAAGTYTVKGEVKEGKPGKEGLKIAQIADCSATFTVKAFEPPTIGCSANPGSIKPGDSSTITAVGVSPQNRPLTYSYSAVAGSVSGTGNTAVFTSTGAPTGDVKVTCNVSDDKGQVATSNTTVTIVAPVMAVVPHTQALCSISFDKDPKRPTRVDNEAKACLDAVALSLQNQSDAKVVVVGEATAAEKAAKPVKRHGKALKAEDLAAQRAVNTKEYLVTDKGIDASRIGVATGSTDGQAVEDYLVPADATFNNDVQGTTLVDETAVKAQARKPLDRKQGHKKAAKKEM